jgi:type II secretory pathway pseudopilin PulG
MDAWTGPHVDDGGESLLELLVAVVIMGIALVAIVSGLVSGILVSDIHRKQTTAGSTLRDYAEAVEAAVASSSSAYTACATTATYASPSGFSAPSGYTSQVTAVRYWNDTSLTFSGTCPSPDGGVQKVSLRVRSNDGRASETVDIVVRKPCRTTDTLCS